VTRLLRFFADTFFAKRYGHRAIVLETIAAVPGMVGATATHLHSLRRMVNDDGWIRTLMEEAENERMHLMTFIEIARPTALERFVILVAQWIFYIGFFLLYLEEIDAGRSPNVAAPAIARRHWKLADDSTLRDVVLVVRADPARQATPRPLHPRDVHAGGNLRRTAGGSIPA
jgi:ubiquinol oxidase